MQVTTIDDDWHNSRNVPVATKTAAVKWTAAMEKLGKLVEQRQLSVKQHQTILQVLKLYDNHRRPSLDLTDDAFIMAWSFADQRDHTCVIRIASSAECEWEFYQADKTPMSGEGSVQDMLRSDLFDRMIVFER